MWQIQEHRRVAKQLHGRTPAEVLKRYQKWKEIVRLYGPDALRDTAGFHDEQLRGQWADHHMKEFLPEARWIEVSTGDSVRIIREFNQLTRAELAELAGIALPILADIENDQLKLDMDNAAALAAALNVTAAVLIAQGHETSSKSAA